MYAFFVITISSLLVFFMYICTFNKFNLSH